MKKILGLVLATALLCCGVTPAFAAPAANAPLLDGATLVTFGDSITALSTWPQDVATAMNMRLVNSGIGGNTTNDAAARFTRDVAAHDPDFVIMCFASNDFQRPVALGAQKVDVATYRANLTTFIADIRAMGATPILMTPPFIAEFAVGGPSYFPEGTVNAALDVYVNAMRDVASSTGTHLIDIHSACDAYTTDQLLIGDGVHLSTQGNAMYTQTITNYLKANFRQDPYAARVEQPVAPKAEPGVWTKSLVPFTEEEWLNIYPANIHVFENADGSIAFANTNGLWPEIHYSPLLPDTICAPVAGTYLTLDMDFEAGSNVRLYFNGPSPTLAYANTYVSLTNALAAAIPHFQTLGDDIAGGQSVQVTLPLSDIVPAEYIAADGTVLFSGVKLYVVGEAGKKVTIRELSITTTDGSAAPTPEYQDVQSLLPTSTAAVAHEQGVADFSLTGDGSLKISRAASSSIAWPSVRVSCNKTVDLSETPYLHLNVNTISGSANGYIYYTTETGNTGVVQISYLVDRSVNDMTRNTDIYVDLAAAIGTARPITITAYTLSVYGEAGATVQWNAITTARDASNDYMLGDVDGNDTLTTYDAMITLQHTLGIITLEGKALKAADYDGNGAVNTADARDILRATL